MSVKKELQKKMQKNADKNGYYLCPDEELLDILLDGLATNKKRYGYESCPCRAASGNKVYDNDIICPCEYRDADVDEYGMCYCGLFVSKKVNDNPKLIGPIPERRPPEIQEAAMNASSKQQNKGKKEKEEIPQVWRCTVCGYLCARGLPPPVCPICKAKAERFEEFKLKAG